MIGSFDRKNTSIILGASSEIGNWIAHGLEELDYNYIKISRNLLCADYKVSSYDNSSELIFILDSLYRNYPSINSLYFCPGSYSKGAISESVDEDWIRDIQINLNCAYIFYKSIIHSTISHSKCLKIVYLGSTASISKPPEFSSYAIAKSALENLVTYINNEKPFHIRATCLRLGTCKTNFSGSSDVDNTVKEKDIINCVKFLEKARIEIFPDMISLRPIRSLAN